jgi:hypothetical protein
MPQPQAEPKFPVSIGLSSQWEIIMQHRGIRYDVRMAAGPKQWVWTVHTPSPKQGEVSGTRDRAVAAAKKAIQAWCYQHPIACEPASDRPAVGTLA